MTLPRTDGCPSASQTRNPSPVDAVPVKPNHMNSGAETAPTGGRCRRHSFFQKRDDARTVAAEARRGRGHERTLLWYCIKVLEQKPVSHSSAAVCNGTFIQRCVREGRRVICDLPGREFSPSVRGHTLVLYFCASMFFFNVKLHKFLQVLSETDISYMNDFNEISAHVGYHGSICTSDGMSWTFDRFESNKAFQVEQPSHWCHIFGNPVGYGIVSRFLKPFERDRRQTSTIHKMVKYTESAESFRGSNNRFTIAAVDQVHVHEEQTINSVFPTIPKSK